LLVLFAFAVPWEYSLDLGEPLGNIARILGVMVLLAATTAALQAGSVRTPGLLEWLVLGLYLYFAASYLWTVEPEETLEKIRAYFQVMMVVWLASELVVEPAHLRWLARGFVAGCWVLAVLTVLDFTSASAIAAEQIRFVAEGQDPNDVARFLDLGFPLAALLFATEENGVLRLLALGYLPAGLLAVLLTASRGGFSAAVAALAGSALLIARWRPRAALAALAGLATLAAGLFWLVPRETLDRLATIPEQLGSQDFNDRFNIWVSGWQAFSQSPWFGSGAGTFVSAAGLAPGDTAHNTAIAVLVTGGLAAFALVLAILVEIARAVARTRGLLRMALATALIVWAITSMVGSVEENRMTWLIFAMMASAGRLAREDPEVMKTMFSSPMRQPGPRGERVLGTLAAT
jgi:O-antigen ligase